MRITSVIEHNGEPALGIPYTNTDGVLFRIRVKALNTGIILEGFHKAVTGEDPGIIMLPHILKVDEQVACDVHPVRMLDVEKWYQSDECISLLDYLAKEDAPRGGPYELAEQVSETPASETDNVSAEDQDHEQDHQDHEPDNDPDVVQNEPELTTLQVQILQELKQNGAGTVAELIDRLNMPGMQAAIRKNLHILMDDKHLIGKRSSTQNGRPAQLWGVM